jgi:2-amino-4-hydroxy-6-hydroxymethyldihydropteridine diphosphokinase
LLLIPYASLLAFVMPIVHIGIGSNLGDRRNNCLKAVALLEAGGVKVLKRSSLYETEPWGVKEQPRFMNMAVEAETDVTPRELLSLLKKIESLMGRTVTVKWGPRTIDLDILFYGDVIMKEPDLEIPHPLMHSRDFVLDPLGEIAAQKVHPLLHRTIAELRAECRRKKKRLP